MAIESAIFFGVAVALPVWLVVEEIMHRELGRVVKSEPSVVRSTRRVPASNAA